MFTIGIVAFEDAEELDFVGPWEVFTMAAMGVSDMKVLLVAETTEPVRCAKGLRVLPDETFESAPELDVIVIPGGQGSRVQMNNPAMLNFITSRAPRCRWVTSVCTGSLILRSAGVATGKRVTTHWTTIDTLRKLGDVEVLENTRYVRDENVVTAAGVSAGIDMSLWLVGQLFDPAHARRTQRLMEYDPAPPYAAEV